MNSANRPLITPAEFIERWNSTPDTDPLQPVLPDYIPGMKTRRMPHESLQFMIEAGLPSDAAPFLSLYHARYGLAPIWHFLGPEDFWNDERREPLRYYGMLGTDGCGNPICLDEERDGAIILLEHDFQPDSFINSSIPQFAEFLLLYGTTCDRLVEMEDEKGNSDPEAVRRERIWLETEFRAIDPEAMAEGGMWYHEIATFEENRL